MSDMTNFVSQELINYMMLAIIVVVGYWFYRRSLFLKLIESRHPELWSKLKPYAFPLIALSDSSLEKYVSRRDYEATKDPDLISLGNKLRIAQKLQIYAVTVVVVYFFGSLLWESIQKVK